MNQMFDDEGSLKRIRFNMKIFKENKGIFDEKHNRTHRFYNNMFDINVERISKTIMINVISKSDLNLIKVLFDALI